MNERDRVYLRHIRDAIDRIERYLQPVSKEEFFEDKMRQDAVIRQLSIFGEAAGDLSEEFQQEYPAIPWSDIYGMRNKLVHDYFGVDLEAVWDTVKQDVPPLSRTVQKALSTLEDE
jgi:uncharacterized protein with HEPN domain